MTVKPRLSLPLLLTVVIPILAGLLLFALVLFSFEAGHRVAVEVRQPDIEELVELAGSSIEECWLEPRSEAVRALARSETLHRRLDGEVAFEQLAEEWKVAQRALEGYFYIYYGLEDGQPLWTAPYEEIITGYMVDQDGDPFIGTDEEIVRSDELPRSTEDVYVASSSALSSGWKISVIVPRESLAESFARLRRPIIMASAVLLLLVTMGLSVIVGRIASRAHHLAAYFREAVEESQPLRELFRSHDEFAYLNRHFNEVVHDARLSEEEKLARERTFRFLVEKAPVGFFRSHRDGTLQYLNTHCAAMLGYTQEEAYDAISSVRGLYDDQAERDRFLHELTRNGEVRNRKIRFIKKSGERIWVSMTARLDEDIESPGEFRIEGFLIDVTADIEERENLVTLAESDPLTGVRNRRAFDAAAEELARHARASEQSVAALAGSVIREHDVFGRLGGDEFGVLLPRSGEDAAARLAERLVEQMKATAPPGGISIQPTLSIGVAALAGADMSVPELIKAADSAMYRAKPGGRNRIVRASDAR